MTDAEIDALVPLPQPGINTASHSHLRVVGYPAEQVLAHTRAAVRAALRARLTEPVQTDLELMRQALDALDAALVMILPKKQNDKARRAAHLLRARLAEPVKAAQPVARWYVLSPDGLACLCADQADAQTQAADADKLFPRHAPHQAVQMAPIAAPGAAPTVQPVAVPASSVTLYECAGCGHLYQDVVSQCDCLQNDENVYREWIAAPKGGA